MNFKIEREEFASLVSEEMMDKLDDKLTDNDYTFQTESFIVHYDKDFEQLYILNRFGLQVVSWYKLTHVGRALETANFDNKEELVAFMKLLEKELLVENN